MRSIQELIDEAEAVLNPHLVRDRWQADVASAIESDSGAVYRGVCLDSGSTGFCAEQAAGAAMLTAGEARVRRIVAVWRDSVGEDRSLQVVPPCGVCRRFLLDLDPANVDAEVVLSSTEVRPLRDIYPLSGWQARPAR